MKEEEWRLRQCYHLGFGGIEGEGTMGEGCGVLESQLLATLPSIWMRLS